MGPDSLKVVQQNSGLCKAFIPKKRIRCCANRQNNTISDDQKSALNFWFISIEFGDLGMLYSNEFNYTVGAVANIYNSIPYGHKHYLR